MWNKEREQQTYNALVAGRLTPLIAEGLHLRTVPFKVPKERKSAAMKDMFGKCP